MNKLWVAKLLLNSTIILGKCKNKTKQRKKKKEKAVAIIWIFSSLQNFYVEILTPKDDGIRKYELWFGRCLGHEHGGFMVLMFF